MQKNYVFVCACERVLILRVSMCAYCEHVHIMCEVCVAFDTLKWFTIGLLMDTKELFLTSACSLNRSTSSLN